jgi:flagellin
MNTIQTNTNNISTYKVSNLPPAELNSSATQLSVSQKTSKVNLNSVVYIKSTSTPELTSAGIASRNINETTALIQSIDDSAQAVEGKLNEMKNLAVRGTGCACQAMQRQLESIKDIANNFSWNGRNYMVGDGQNDQSTSALDLVVDTANEKTENLKLTFKSFNPMSAVDTDGSIDPVKPNLPDLNKSAGTDTHAYGDAAMYSGLNKDDYLHIHNESIRNHTILQLTRATDGITAERARLASYINQLTHLQEKIQPEGLNANQQRNQILDIEYAKGITEISKTEILKNSSVAIMAQANHEGKNLAQLLN